MSGLTPQRIRFRTSIYGEANSCVLFITTRDMADVAIVIGHHPTAPGATLELGDHSIYEYHFWKPFARELAASFDTNWNAFNGVDAVYVIERPNPNPDEKLAARVNETNADATIELHFNSFSDEAAQGTEMLHWHNSVQGEKLAELLHKRTTKALDTHHRGAKGRDGSDRGGTFLRLTAMPAVICEPAFGSNEDDAWKLLTRQADLLQAYRLALIEYLSDA